MPSILCTWLAWADFTLPSRVKVGCLAAWSCVGVVTGTESEMAWAADMADAQETRGLVANEAI